VYGLYEGRCFRDAPAMTGDEGVWQIQVKRELDTRAEYKGEVAVWRK